MRIAQDWSRLPGEQSPCVCWGLSPGTSWGHPFLHCSGSDPHGQAVPRQKPL